MSVSIQCEKEFTLSVVAGLPTPIEYWKFEESAGNPRVGQVQGVNLIEEFGPITNTIGKIGNAIHFVGNNFPPQFLDNSPANEPKLRNLGTGFSICGWFKIDAFLVGSVFIDLTFYDISTISQGEVFGQYSTVAGQIRASFGGTDAVGNNFTISGNGPVLTLATWHFFRLWFDPSTGTINLSIDEGTDFTSDLAGLSFPASHGGYIDIDANNTGDNFDLDEMGLFMPQLTTGQGLLLYNAGAGKTCCPFT